jgi:hypothetical protein
MHYSCSLTMYGQTIFPFLYLLLLFFSCAFFARIAWLEITRAISCNNIRSFDNIAAVVPSILFLLYSGGLTCGQYLRVIDKSEYTITIGEPDKLTQIFVGNIIIITSHHMILNSKYGTYILAMNNIQQISKAHERNNNSKEPAKVNTTPKQPSDIIPPVLPVPSAAR